MSQIFFQIIWPVHVHLKTDKVDLKKRPPWKKNFLHFFSIDSSSRHEKYCQMLQRLFWLFQCSKNPLWEGFTRYFLHSQLIGIIPISNWKSREIPSPYAEKSNSSLESGLYKGLRRKMTHHPTLHLQFHAPVIAALKRTHSPHKIPPQQTKIGLLCTVRAPL